MTTPNDQNFEAFPNDNQSTGVDGPRTLGSFVVEGHRTDAAGADGGNPGSTHALTTLLFDAASIGSASARARFSG